MEIASAGLRSRNFSKSIQKEKEKEKERDCLVENKPRKRTAKDEFDIIEQKPNTRQARKAKRNTVSFHSIEHLNQGLQEELISFAAKSNTTQSLNTIANTKTHDREQSKPKQKLARTVSSLNSVSKNTNSPRKFSQPRDLLSISFDADLGITSPQSQTLSPQSLPVPSLEKSSDNCSFLSIVLNQKQKTWRRGIKKPSLVTFTEILTTKVKLSQMASGFHYFAEYDSNDSSKKKKRSLSLLARLNASNTPQELRVPSFEMIFSSPPLLLSYDYFLEQHIALENLYFFNLVLFFKSKRLSDENRLEFAQAIFKNFVIDNSNCEINISGAIKSTLKKKIFEDKDIDSNLFDEAKNEVVRNLQQDLFLPWVLSGVWKQIEFRDHIFPPSFEIMLRSTSMVQKFSIFLHISGKLEDCKILFSFHKIEEIRKKIEEGEDLIAYADKVDRLFSECFTLFSLLDHNEMDLLSSFDRKNHRSASKKRRNSPPNKSLVEGSDSLSSTSRVRRNSSRDGVSISTRSNESQTLEDDESLRKQVAKKGAHRNSHSKRPNSIHFGEFEALDIKSISLCGTEEKEKDLETKAQPKLALNSMNTLRTFRSGLSSSSHLPNHNDLLNEGELRQINPLSSSNFSDLLRNSNDRNTQLSPIIVSSPKAGQETCLNHLVSPKRTTIAPVISYMPTYSPKRFHTQGSSKVPFSRQLSTSLELPKSCPPKNVHESQPQNGENSDSLSKARSKSVTSALSQFTNTEEKESKSSKKSFRIAYFDCEKAKINSYFNDLTILMQVLSPIFFTSYNIWLDKQEWKLLPQDKRAQEIAIINKISEPPSFEVVLYYEFMLKSFAQFAQTQHDTRLLFLMNLLLLKKETGKIAVRQLKLIYQSFLCVSESNINSKTYLPNSLHKFPNYFVTSVVPSSEPLTPASLPQDLFSLIQNAVEKKECLNARDLEMCITWAFNSVERTIYLRWITTCSWIHFQFDESMGNIVRQEIASSF